MDKNIPEKYRASVQAGILEWNKAFEKIGFKDAVQAKQQPDDADWDNMDSTHASVRWFTGADVGFAIGPSNKDPRTGEILDADIGMSDVFGRGSRRLAADDVLPGGQPGQNAFSSWTGRAHPQHGHRAAVHLHGRPGLRVRLRAGPAGAAGWGRGHGHERPRGRGAGTGRHQGRGDARGRPHAGPEAQLPLVHDGHAGAAQGQGVHRGATASPTR